MSKSRNRPFSNCSTCLPIVTKPNHQFLADLLRHSRPNRHNPSFVPPTLCGRTIDLRALYNEVAIRGGHKQVTSLHQWNEVYMALGFPTGCVDAGHGLRTIYQRFLESFERTQRMAAKSTFATDDLDSSICVDTDSQDVDTGKSAKQLLPLAGAPSPKAEDIPNHLRESWNLSTDLLDRVDYIGLERSLQSNLPNEVDFALNTMLLMSSQPNGFSLYKNERLLELLLISVGITSSDLICPQTYSYITDVQDRFQKFWYANILEPSGRTFLIPELFDIAVESPISLVPNESRCLTQIHDMAYGDDEGFRVQLVATVIRNLAVEGGSSAVIIGRHPQALRFIFLCIHANHSSLRQLGLETLSSLHFPVVGPLGPALHVLIPDLVTSSDRNDQMRGLQLLGRLCEAPMGLARHNRSLNPPDGNLHLPSRDFSVLSNDRNAAFLSTLPSTVFEHLVKTLCLRDLHLVILALDAVYNLSCLGRILCRRMLGFPAIDSFPSQVRSHFKDSLLSILVALLRLEAQAMGSDSMIRLRVMQALSSNTNTTGSKPIPNVTRHLPSPATLPPPLPSAPLPPPTLPSTVVCRPNPPLPHSSLFARYSLPLPVTLPTTIKNTSNHAAIPVAPVPNLLSLRPSALDSRPSAMSNRPVGKSETATVQLPTVVSARAPTNPSLMPPTSVSIVVSASSTPAPTVTTSSTGLKLSVDPSLIVSLPQPSSTTSSSTVVSSPVVSISHQSVPLLSPGQHDAIKKSNTVPNPEPRSPVVSMSSTTEIPVKLPARPLFRSRPPLLHRSGARKPARCLVDKPAIAHSASTRLEYMFEWLRKNYVMHNHSSVSRVQIYMDYQRAHQRRFGTITTAISPVEFHTLIKSVFPGVGQVKVQVPGDKVIIHYNNLRCLHSPESNTEQGVNDIMAAVLSPTKQDAISATKRVSKSKNRKRSNTRPLTTNTPVKRVALWPQPNGHTESKQLVNGCVLATTSNGLTKDLVNLISQSAPTVSSTQTNGTSIQAQSNPIKSSATGMTPCPKLNELVSHEHGLVLFPVFTTLNFNPAAAVANHAEGGAGLEQSHTINPDSTSSPTVVSTQKGIKRGSSTSSLETAKTPLTSKPTLMPRPTLTSPPMIDRTSPKSATTTNVSSAPSQITCRWKACAALCKDAKDLSEHLCSNHVSVEEAEQRYVCMWSGCNHSDAMESVDQLRIHVCEKHAKSPSELAVGPANTVLVNGTSSDCPDSTLITTSQSLAASSEINRVPVAVETSGTSEQIVSVASTSTTTSNLSSITTSSSDPLFRHPSSMNDPTSAKTELRERQLIHAATVDNHTVIRVTTQPNCTERTHHTALGLTVPPPPAIMSLVKPTVWCSSPDLSEECRRAMAGGAPNPAFDQTPNREGPVTKHIRLTAALTLKNLLRYSQAARSFMTPREELLSDLAFAGLESSPTILDCLSLLHESTDLCAGPVQASSIPPFV